MIARHISAPKRPAEWTTVRADGQTVEVWTFYRTRRREKFYGTVAAVSGCVSWQSQALHRSKASALAEVRAMFQKGTS